MKTQRLTLHAASREEMEQFISSQTDDILKAAYSEMLEGCVQHPEQWDWYAIWMIALQDGTHIGELCFKGLRAYGSVEIGYGISSEFQGQGYATEAVGAVMQWAFKQPGVLRITAETEPENTASIRVLEKCGFRRTGAYGEDGLLFDCTNPRI